MSLATAGPEGLWAADVFFAADGLRGLYFLSSPSSRHSRDLLNSATVAATVHPEPGADWRAIRGLQIQGDASVVEADGLEHARSIYLAKFPFVASLLKPDSEIAAKTSGTRFFQVRVRRLYLVDNSLGFGTRLEIDLTTTEG